MRREYQVRWNEEIIFISNSYRSCQAICDVMSERLTNVYIYEDIFFDDEPNP